jgi:nicotinamidase-related amidase
MKSSNNTSSQTGEQGRTALLVIDVQQGLFRRSTPIYQAETLLDNINDLVAGAYQAGAPVYYVQHSNQKILVKGSLDWRLHPQLQPTRQDGLIHKLYGNAFQDTNLDEMLRSQGVNTLVITGLVTQGCVKATCLGGIKMGYRVILVSDAHSNYNKQAVQVIAEWHEKLSAQAVVLQPACEVTFG